MEEQKVGCLYYETNIHPEIIADVILDYSHAKECAETFLDEELTLRQCDKWKNRSIDDMILIVRRFFPEADCADVLSAIAELNVMRLEQKKIALMVYYCPDINRPVFLKHPNAESLLNNLFYKDHVRYETKRRSKGTSEYSIWDLEQIYNERLKEKEEANDTESNRQIKGESREAD